MIPSNKSLPINDGVLKLALPPQAAHLEAMIDVFLQSLARDQQEFSIGIVLSGTGTSGTVGVKEIKLAGGLAIAQQPESAEFDQMPKNAIATGLIDAILPPEEMPSAIASFIRQPWLTHLQRIEDEKSDEAADLNEILSLVQGQTRYDFRPYRRNMILRRVLRRMGLHETQTLADYLRYLNENPSEISSLCNDLLIGVTAFFRDSEVYQELEVEVIAPLVRRLLSPIPKRKTNQSDSFSTEAVCDITEPIRV